MLKKIPEVAERLRVTPARLYALVRAGVLPRGVAVRIGRQVRINPKRLEAWLNEGGRGLSDGAEG